MHEINLNTKMGDDVLKREKEVCLLGINFDEHLSWHKHVKETVVLKKLKNFTNFRLRKQLAESLLVSKIDFNDFVYAPLNLKHLKKLERLHLAICSFVCGKYVKSRDIPRMFWLTVRERRDFHVMKLTHKAIYDPTWPSINNVKIRTYERTLRSNNKTLVQPSSITGTFQQHAYNTYNELALPIRNCQDHKQFCSKSRAFLLDRSDALLNDF